MNYTELMNRIEELKSRKGRGSISADETFSLLMELAGKTRAVDINAGSLTVRRVYASVAAMNADRNPMDQETGKALKFGQLACVCNPNDLASPDNGKIYRYNKPGWEFLRQVGDMAQFARTEEVNGKITQIEREVSGYSYPVSENVTGNGAFVYAPIKATIGDPIRITVTMQPAQRCAVYYVRTDGTQSEGVTSLTPSNNSVDLAVPYDISGIRIYVNGMGLVTMTVYYIWNLSARVDTLNDCVYTHQNQIADLSGDVYGYNVTVSETIVGGGAFVNAAAKLHTGDFINLSVSMQPVQRCSVYYMRTDGIQIDGITSLTPSSNSVNLTLPYDIMGIRIYVNNPGEIVMTIMTLNDINHKIETLSKEKLSKVDSSSFLGVTPSVNLFYPNSGTPGYLNNVGAVVENPIYWTSDYIKVVPDTIYSFGYARFIFFYTKNKVPIKSTYIDKGNAASSTIVTTSESGYARITFLLNNISRAMVVRGEILPDRYVPYAVEVPFIKMPPRKYNGKRMVCFGDSITMSVDETDRNNWCRYLSEATGIVTYNQGYSSGRVSIDTDQVKNSFSFYNLVASIISGDYSGQSQLYVTPGYEQHARQLDKLKNIDFSTIDFVSIALGTNDLSSSTPFEIADNPLSINSINGAFRYGISNLLIKWPQLKFMIMTPIYRFVPATGEDYLNNDGIGIAEMTNDLLILGEELKIPVVNMFSTLGVNRYNKDHYFGVNGGDGLHPLFTMKEVMGHKMAGAITSLY